MKYPGDPAWPVILRMDHGEYSGWWREYRVWRPTYWRAFRGIVFYRLAGELRKLAKRIGEFSERVVDWSY